MKIPLKWLKDYVDVTLPPAELARRLTMAGFEIQEIKTIGGNWENIVIGQIKEINPHPNADRLRLPTVDLGNDQQAVVCGAPNLQIGDKIAFAKVGAELTDPHTGQKTKLTPAKIRGVVSSGMVCSEKELGLSEKHEGILVLPQDAPIGVPLAEYLGEVILDLDITPNRADCLSVTGIAHEVAALTGQKMHIPDIAYEETGKPIDQQISVEIASPELCRRYCASLITGINVAESPHWLQERLQSAGMRPINNVVDITNYVMLEYGQPLHSFDYDRIRGKKIIIRRAREGETTFSLDGIERKLSENTLVIADAERTVAIAGVMGGANSEVSDTTSSILLESANFNPASIHFTSRKLGLSSEASMRFERGITPGLTIPALKHATQLILQLAGGSVAAGLVDVYPGKQEPKPILITQDDVKRLLDLDLTIEHISDVLTSLGFDCKTSGKNGVKVTAPYWRGDINLAVDLVEEVARIVGYDKIPTTLLGEPIPHPHPNPVPSLRKKLRQGLVGYGFQELITFSLTSRELLQKSLSPDKQSPAPMPIRMANPMTAEQEYLRPTLRADLLSALESNRRHEDGGISLFELGKVYLPKTGNLPDEPDMLCAVLSGLRQEKSWLTKEEPFGFFDAVGIIEGILGQVGVTTAFEPGQDPGLHPVRQAAILGNGTKLGVVGEVHPKVLDAFEITGPVYLFEIDFAALLPLTLNRKMFEPLPRFPAIVRDLALVVDAEITNQRVQNIIRKFPLVKMVKLFDVYSGGQITPGKKSLAYRVVYQSPDHTLTDKEVDDTQTQVLDRLSKELGAVLRS